MANRKQIRDDLSYAKISRVVQFSYIKLVSVL